MYQEIKLSPANWRHSSKHNITIPRPFDATEVCLRQYIPGNSVHSSDSLAVSRRSRLPCPPLTFILSSEWPTYGVWREGSRLRCTTRTCSIVYNELDESQVICRCWHQIQRLLGGHGRAHEARRRRSREGHRGGVSATCGVSLPCRPRGRSSPKVCTLSWIDGGIHTYQTGDWV